MREHGGKAGPSPTAAWQEVAVDVARCLRFYSRLPVPALPWEEDPYTVPDFQRLTRILPLAGLILGVLPAAILVASLSLGFGS